MIIAFEGIDGAGKNTLVTAVEEELLGQEVPVARANFPRYEQSIHAQLAQQALRGGMGDITDSIYGMATLFALDRAEVADQLASLDEDGYVVLLDRYVGSNAAYSAARAGWEGEGAAEDQPEAAWIADLEFLQLGCPVPDLQVFVATPPKLAAERAGHREQMDASRARDAYELDGGLQRRTTLAYQALARDSWQSPWAVVEPGDIELQVKAVIAAIESLPE